MKIRCALIFIATTMFISWSPVTSVCYAMPKVDSSQVVNGAAKPKSGAAGAADRCVKLVGSGTKVAGSVAKETAKGAAKGAAVGAQLLVKEIKLLLLVVLLWEQQKVHARAIKKV